MQNKTLSLIDTIALIVGIVVGVGIFKTPSLVAANSGTIIEFTLLWIAGGAVSLMGALCYGELATAYPHPGGDYHYIGRAFGKKPAFFFAWSRMMVIQTGSIAMLAFVFGDYMSQVFPSGAYASPIYAALSVAVLTCLNIIGIKGGKSTQNFLSGVKVLGLLIIFFAGIFSSHGSAASSGPSTPPQSALGLAMIFVLLTYGGWNEAAYVSSEMRHVERNMVRALVWGILVITGIYLSVNLVFAKVLGLTAMGQSEAVASDVMSRIAGVHGALLISLFISVSALGSINATIITGARTNYALGTEFALFSRMGVWNEKAGTPVNALIIQGIISLLLILLGALTRKGFVTIVEYTAPVFWLFFLLATLSLIVLRVREPQAVRPFRVPFYPFTPILFAVVSVYMLVSSVQYTGIGALVGIGVLLAGIPFLVMSSYLNAQR